MSQRRTFEEIEVDSVWTSAGRTVTEADLTFHAGHVGDFDPRHVDAEFCKDLIFGQRIVHASLVLGFSLGLANRQGNTAAFIYGLDRVRFPRPVFLGDTLHVRVTVIEKQDDPQRPQHGRVIELCETLNQKDETVLACQRILLVQRRRLRESE